jgi:hypothetical protein
MPGRFILALLLGWSARGESADDLRELVRRSLSALEQSNEKMAAYTYVRRTERKDLSSDGALKSVHTWVIRREPEDGFPIVRLLERDGKPVPEEERRKNDEAIRKRLAELKAMPPEQRRRHQEENRNKRRKDDAWLKEAPEALDFQLAGEEIVNDRRAFALDCSPHKGYHPKNLFSRVFEKMRGRIWIDKAESELVKADMEVFDSVHIGWGVVGRIEKGSRLVLQRQKAADGTWLPQEQTVKFSARMMLFKSIHNEVTIRYSDYLVVVSSRAALKPPAR